MFYTVSERSDGFGAQLQTMVCCILIAEHSGNKYIHTPIKNMEHNYDNEEDFISKAEECMNLKNNYDCIDDIDNLTLVTKMNIGQIINTFESNINVYLNSESLKNIKKNFWKNKNRNFFSNDHMNISVHIRRHNKHDNRINGTDTPLEYYFNLISYIKQKYSDKKLTFHIYSQNDISDYDKFDKSNLSFHLNENVFDTFTGLVAADILITSRSSFSYTAAILSDGEIYYQPFWHRPGEKWIICP